MALADTSNGRFSLGNDTVLIQIPPPRDEQWIARVETKFPGLKVRWEQLHWKPGDSTEEGVVDASAETWSGVTIACLFLPHTAHLMSSVRYVQLTSAGVDKWVKHETWRDPGVALCTASGVHPPQIAEWVMGTWLMMRNGYLEHALAQQQARWSTAAPAVQDSPGMRMGILGYGAIGRQVARLASAMGIEVYAFTRGARNTPKQRRDNGYSLPGMGDAEGVIPKRWFHGTSRAAVNDFLGQDLDVLVLSLPLTEESASVLGREQFDILAARGAGKTFVSNVARGRHIDTEALVEALEQGKIRGAAVDVTDPEPLPDGHPLFTAPNVFITPHIGFKTQSYFSRVLAILEANLDRLSRGEELLNAVKNRT